MDRLTYISDGDCLEEGTYILNPDDPEGAYNITDLDMTDDADLLNAIADRLAAYEEMGDYDRLRELVEADKDGRVIVLPSKKVYELVWDAGDGCNLKCDDSGGCIYCAYGDLFVYERNCTQARLAELGKTVFLTKEEAEAAMKEVQKRLSIISAASVGCGSIVTSGTAGRSGEGWKDRCVMKDEPKGLISVKIQSRSPVKCIDCIYWAKNKEMDDSHYCKCKESPYYLRSTRSGCVYKEWM